MSTEYGRIHALEKGQPAIIVPVEDKFTVVYDPARCAIGEICMLQSPTWKPNQYAFEFAQKEFGGNWIMALWDVMVEGVSFVNSNPLHKDGYWLYLLVRG
jgi:hypothetical protein